MWLACPEGFIQADVIRWREGIWHRRSARGKPERVGDRLVIAEVLSAPDKDGFVTLLVRSCTVLPRREGEEPPKAGMLKSGKEERRQQATVLRGQVERMTWPEGEDVRQNIIGSRFMRPRAVPSVSRKRNPRGNYAGGGPRTGKGRQRRPNFQNQDRDKAH